MNLARSILFVGAHCDDIELLAGATLARAMREKIRIGVLVFSDHRGIVDDERACSARREFESNMAWLEREFSHSIEDRTTFMLRACSGEFQSRRGEIYAALEALRETYDWVVTHPKSDTNQDHEQVAIEARRVFKAHASLLAGEFPSNDVGRFSPRLFVEVTERDVDAKVRMVQAYESQKFGGRPYFDARAIAGLAYARGGQIRAAAAEAFDVIGRVIARV